MYFRVNDNPFGVNDNFFSSIEQQMVYIYNR